MKTPFIRNDQYNFIKFTDSLVQGHASINDENVLDALKCNALDQVFNLFPDLSSIKSFAGEAGRSGRQR